MKAAGLTDVGVTRSQNQDAIHVSETAIGPLPNLFIVADGMGGHKAGDVASNLAITEFCKFIINFPAKEFVLPENYLDLLVNAAQHANGKITKKAQTDETMNGMGTTLTACVIAAGKIFGVHIGDSRAYTINVNGMKQLTTDHTFVHELMQTGRVSEEEAKTHPKRHILTKVLGASGFLEADGIVHELGDAAAVLLCSDGLYNMVSDETIMKTVNGFGDAKHRIKYLIDEANRNGGKDNISAVLIDIDD